jgi:hypothetical protein
LFFLSKSRKIVRCIQPVSFLCLHVELVSDLRLVWVRSQNGRIHRLCACGNIGIVCVWEYWDVCRSGRIWRRCRLGMVWWEIRSEGREWIIACGTFSSPSPSESWFSWKSPVLRMGAARMPHFRVRPYSVHRLACVPRLRRRKVY